MAERIQGRRGVAHRRSIRAHEPLCRTCKAKGRVRLADEVDHIVPLHQGGTNDLHNLQPLCWECHREKTTGKPVVHIGVDGWAIEK